MSVFDWLTTASSNGNSDASINFQENQAPSTVNDSARALMARVAYWVKMLSGNNTQGGSSNAYTITTGESLSAYAANMRFLWTPNADSTGATTLNVDAIGAKKVYLPTGVQAGSGDIESNSVYDVVYQTALDSAAGGFKIVGFLTPAETASGLLTKIKTVDGAGSGLDADTLDGVQASAFAQLSGAAFTGASSVSSSATNPLTVSQSATTDGAVIARFEAQSGRAVTISQPTPYDGATAPFVFGTANSMSFQVDSSDALVLDSAGNVDVPNAFTAGSIQAPPAVGTTTSGTLVAADANCSLGHLTGNITIPASVFEGNDIIIGGSAGSRTITRGSGLTMYVNGSNVASCTLAARGVFGIYFIGGTYCYVTGDVS